MALNQGQKNSSFNLHNLLMAYTGISSSKYFISRIRAFTYTLSKNGFFFFGCVGFCCCARAFSGGERGLVFVAVHGLLIAVSSLVAEHGL